LNADTGFVSLTPRAGKADVLAALATVTSFGLVVVDQADVTSKAGRDTLFESIDAGLKRGRAIA
jgi:hypothetical protein